MHELFDVVLSRRDLSKAGDLFSLDDRDIEADLSAVLGRIQEIIGSPTYLTSNNDQSVVEICINRVTAAIRETGSIESHVPALVSLLDACLRKNLKPSARDEDPPHAKIASDLLSCVFLNYSQKAVMERALPTAVRFLQQGNRELSRNMASYLSLAAIDNARLLAGQIYMILDSIVYHKNKSLARVLLQIYPENQDPIHDQMPRLVALLAECDASDKQSVLRLCGRVARDRPRLLETFVPLLAAHLAAPATTPLVLDIFLQMAPSSPEPFLGHVTQLKQTAEQQGATLGTVAQILAAVGRTDKMCAKDVVSWLVSQLPASDSTLLAVTLRQVKVVAEAYPSILCDHMGEIHKAGASGSVAAQGVVGQLQELANKSTSLPERRTVASQTEGIVTVISPGSAPGPGGVGAKAGGGQRAGPPNTRSASTSTRDISSAQPTLPAALPPPTAGPATHGSTHTLPIRLPSSSLALGMSQTFGDRSTPIPPTGPVTSIATITRTTIAGSKVHMEDRKPMPTVSTTTMPTYAAQPYAIPFRDTIQHFCEKHLAKIKSYVDNVSARLPIPIKAVKEDHKHKRRCKLSFICYGQSQNCVYSQSFFTMRTKIPRTWIHLMFLAIQARSDKAVSQQDPSVGNLKALWDSLKADASTGNFVRLVTSTFPSTKAQDALLLELRGLRYLDVFQFNGSARHWACFLCNQPERSCGPDPGEGPPLMEGQLKEKRGRWKIFKRWKTRYMTLSGAAITYSKKDERKASLAVSTIQTVKAVRRGVRDIPRAFEIFTTDQTYVFKAKDSRHVEQWVTCLQMALASRSLHDQVSAAELDHWGAPRPVSRGRSVSSSGPSLANNNATGNNTPGNTTAGNTAATGNTTTMGKPSTRNRDSPTKL